jgi:hypothetical protein
VKHQLDRSNSADGVVQIHLVRLFFPFHRTSGCLLFSKWLECFSNVYLKLLNGIGVSHLVIKSRSVKVLVHHDSKFGTVVLEGLIDLCFDPGC